MNRKMIEEHERKKQEEKVNSGKMDNDIQVNVKAEIDTSRQVNNFVTVEVSKYDKGKVNNITKPKG